MAAASKLRHPRAEQERSFVAKTPRIHAVTSAEGRSGAEFCTVATLQSHGMDPRVCAASLRSLLCPRMTRRGAFRPTADACDPLRRQHPQGKDRCTPIHSFGSAGGFTSSTGL
ncbi:hypothetical protein MPL3365_180179 [Mesorhizobium plurifarium]|uniref:Uncharacterized protein n=1 Tax=Mesorhizobium plurifarium TaxID=69974 RepID=A0A090G0B4_MESPL|nr:hypothetical protein MPL3365_180179 [Mesorhizobium plurifarium]